MKLRDRADHGGEGPPRGAVWSSVALHGALVALTVLVTVAPELPPAPPVYRARLVAISDPEAPLRVDPAPAQTAEEEHRPPPPQPTPERRPETEQPTIEEETPVAEPDPEPARTDEEGEEAVNVQLDGSIFPFPEYLDNIIRQVQRYWRPPAGGRAFRAEVEFVIQEDGSVTGIEWVLQSGDATFDLVAKGAVEAAGRSQAFGPLPDGYPRDRLRVRFFFDPSRR